MDKPSILMLLDLETQSRRAISDPRYTSDESTKALCMSWGLIGGVPKLWWGGDPCPQELRDHIEAGGMLGASNARFRQRNFAVCMRK